MRIESGILSKVSTALYTNAQSRELDRIATEKLGIPGLSLMKRAGKVIFDYVMEKYPGLSPVVVLCGAGNNGGDGYVVAKLLHEASIAVQVLTSDEPATADAKQAYREYVSAGGYVTDCSADVPQGAALLIDAMFGAGLSRPLEKQYAALVEVVNQGSYPVVAVDLPSGLSGDTGSAFDPCIHADLTITFIGRKLGQYTGDGPDHCGQLVFDNLGLDASIYETVSPVAHLTNGMSVTPRIRNSHKGQYGHLMIAGGEPDMLGSILLAGRAGLRGGAGLVTLISQSSHLGQVPFFQPELMTRTSHSGMLSTDPFTGADAVVFGPGVKDSDWSHDLFRKLTTDKFPVVLDAGALHLLAATPDYHENRVLTPHPGEAAALLGCSSQKVQSDRPAATAAIQQIYGGVCVLKGAGTIIHSNQETEICPRGNPGMASAGMGDVLSGIIGALLAQGLSPWNAAREGVWWHAIAGDCARDALGERSLLATDVIEHLPLIE